MQTILTRGLSAGSLYKLLYIGLVIPLSLFFLFCAIASYFGFSTVSLNGDYVFGIKGLITGCVLGIIFPIIFAGLLWCLIAFGLWVWTRLSRLTLTIKE